MITEGRCNDVKIYILRATINNAEKLRPMQHHQEWYILWSAANFQGHRPSGHENSALDGKCSVGRSELSVWHIDETSLDQKTCS